MTVLNSEDILETLETYKESVEMLLESNRQFLDTISLHENLTDSREETSKNYSEVETFKQAENIVARGKFVDVNLENNHQKMDSDLLAKIEILNNAKKILDKTPNVAMKFTYLTQTRIHNEYLRNTTYILEVAEYLQKMLQKGIVNEGFQYFNVSVEGIYDGTITILIEDKDLDIRFKDIRFQLCNQKHSVKREFEIGNVCITPIREAVSVKETLENLVRKFYKIQRGIDNISSNWVFSSTVESKKEDLIYKSKDIAYSLGRLLASQEKINTYIEKLKYKTENKAYLAEHKKILDFVSGLCKVEFEEMT